MTSLQKIVIATIAGLVAISATSALGFWQLRRAAGKEALQSQIDAAQRAEPTTPDARSLHDASGLIHQHLHFRGRWEPERVVYLDNRPQAGQAGFYVLMPLRIEQPIASEVIVNRGWTPRNINDRARIDTYRTADGLVDVTGVALAEEPRLLELSKSAAHPLGGIWQNFDFDDYARASGQKPVALVLRQDEEASAGVSSSHDASSDGLSRAWPDHGGALQGQIDRHHGYALQWFALAATFAALLMYQIFRVIRHGRAIPN